MPSITEQEKAIRRKSMASVRGTHEMEGIFLDDQTLAIMHSYEEGHLTLEQFSEAIDRYADSMVRTKMLAGAA